MDTIRKLNLKISNHQPKTLAEALDVLSYKLLSIKQNLAQTNALKLSLSHIIYFDGSSLEVFEEFFSRKDTGIKALYEQAKVTTPKLTDCLIEKIKGKFNSLAACSSNDPDLVRAEVCKMKADLLVVKDHDKEIVKVLNVLDYVIMNLEANSSKESKSTCYRKTACVLNILFISTPLRLIDGEHSSEATKDARNINMRAADDGDEKKDLIGRKIDLIIKESGVEMNSSEWKKSAITAIIKKTPHLDY